MYIDLNFQYCNYGKVFGEVDDELCCTSGLCPWRQVCMTCTDVTM